MKNSVRDVIFIILSGYVCYLSIQIITTIQEEQPSNQAVLILIAVAMLLAGIVFIFIYGKSLYNDFVRRNNNANEVSEEESSKTGDTKKIDVGNIAKQDTVKMPKSIFNKKKK